jgi:short-subunit dehydrogenase
MNIIITGASRGIGYEAVKILAAKSGNRIIAIARNKKRLEKLKEECDFIQPHCLEIIVADLEESDTNEKLVAGIKQIFSSIDVLINNAGMIVNKPFQHLTDADLNRIYRVNVFSVFKLIRDLMPLMKTEAGLHPSHVINISSMGGVQGSTKFPGLAAYSSSKAAVSVLTECLAEELKEYHIAVNCLAFGAVQTEMLREAFPGYEAPLSASEAGRYLANFALTGQQYFNGKVLQVASTIP